MVQGEAVKSFTVMFLKMWAVSEKTENMAVYLRPVPAAGPKAAEAPDALATGKENALAYRTAGFDCSRGYVLPYAESPFAADRTAQRVYLEIINSATHYVHIMTPYLVPDQELLQALCYAAKRGVDVKLILPHIPDKKYAFALASSLKFQ